MTGCPSREQLVNFVAERTIEIEDFDLGEHTRSCPTCRALLRSLSLEGTTDSGRNRSGRPTTEAPNAALADDEPNTLADSGQTVDTFVAGPAPASSHDLAAHPSAQLSSFDTIDTAFRPSSPSLSLPAEPSSSETINTSFRAPAAPSSMDTIDSAFNIASPSKRVIGTASGARSSSNSSEDTQQATMDSSLANSEATLELSEAGPPGLRRTVPGSSARPNIGGKAGPDDYEILGELGRGGMGIVYKALHRRLNRMVALKMIRGGVHADDIQVTRFRIEAEAVAALRHPNILQIYDIGEADGLPYVALELLEGGSLAEKLHGTPLPPRKAAEWMVPMAMAMDTAHRAGIVHRDLKSVNILFTADGVPKVTDFGLAKRLEVDEGHTHTGQVMGTPSYMAPEQARGDTKNVGPPADIYALGAILYEMLTGRPPFKGVSAMDTVKQVIEVEPVAPSRVQYRVPQDLETICLKCLQKEVRKRYATAKDMADDLNRYLTGEPIKARRTPPIERAIKWVKRHPTVTVAAACAVMGMMTLVGYGAWYWNLQRTLERIAQQHDTELKKDTTNDLFNAQKAISSNDLTKGHEILATRIGLLAAEPRRSGELSELFDRTKTTLGEVDRAIEAESGLRAEQQAKDAVQKRYRNFVDLRKETLFRDTQFTGLMLPTNHDLTRKAAEGALGVFGRSGDATEWTLAELPASLSIEQQADVKEGFYELLLVLADATSTQGPGQTDRALRILDSADRLRPGHSRAYHMKKAACLALKGDKDAQARELANARNLRPETAFDYFLSGQQEYKDHRYADAIRDFAIVLRQKPDHFWAKCLQAICYIQTKEYEGAKSDLTGCVDTDRNFAWLYLLRGFASGQIGTRDTALAKSNAGREAALKGSAAFEFDEAEADFQQALTRLQTAPDLDLQYVLFVNRGVVRFERGAFDKAAADFEQAIQVRKDPFLAHASLAKVYEKQGKTDLAIEQFDRAIAIRPDWSPLYRGRAAVLQASGDKDAARRAAALSDLEKSILYEKAGERVLALDHTNRGLLLYHDERFEDALAESKLALEADAAFLQAHVLQARSLLKLRRVDEVIRSCDAAVALGKKSAVLFELRGLANFDGQNYAAAIRDFGEAIELHPDDSQLLTRRGWMYLTFDSPKLALADFVAAIKRDPAVADAYNGRGAVLALRGDHAAGVADAREALKRGATNPRILYNAARIYAIAAAAAAKEPGEKGRQARQLSIKYEDAALQLIRQAFEREEPGKRATFWRETVQPDPALKSIRRRIKFEDLIVTNK
jgi:tetratricopeptide (TPR) repeat protein